MDDFANIAANGIGGRQELLTENEPHKYKKRVSELRKTEEKPISLKPKMSTKEELYAELEEQRKKYAPFLKNYAPPITELTERLTLTEFTLDGKKITIPYYGGPSGYCKQIYETDFELDDIKHDKAYYICFKGADYRAVVYINGTCVGTHEGFFSPFEFNIDESVKPGKNSLKIELYNDYIYMGNAFATQEKIEGDKLYAATGLGWDDAQTGWHHCPPGMGLFDEVCLEIRSRISISDMLVRDGELWIEVISDDYQAKPVEFNISVYGQNFEETVIKDYRYIPSTMKTVGMGDSLTEASVGDELGKGIPMPLKKGVNIYKIPLKLENPKIWDLETPYLYQLQAEVISEGTVCDRKKRQFGIRSFVQDTESTQKGMFYLNGRKIRLRGANTMGFEQQDVMRGDIEQLIDDILLAKICNMNFLRLTQRPVQAEVYEYCDRLGLMTQTDLPLFGCMRRNKFAEGVRQAEEMERIVRNHPCNVIISYINEPFPNANNEPHRHLTREELESFFDCCDAVVRLQNPDRVIKHIDGDYDPPCKTMPDNHCYPMWYNGHGIDAGLLHKGYWLPTKPGWYCGCGEYGAEGLDFAEVMREEYPPEWLTEPFDPNNIVNAQTGNFHYFFYDKGNNLEDWVEKSQQYQAFATSFMTEAFRRNNNMISTAIHLFIDAWPSGWMKTIMDCRRNPKPAYFAYKNSLEPLMLSLRTDRFTYYEGEKISVECYLCNDTELEGKYTLRFEADGMACEEEAEVKACEVTYVSNAEFTVNSVEDRKNVTLRAILIDRNGVPVTYAEQTVEVFAREKQVSDVKNELVFDLQPGEYEIAGERVTVKSCGMLPVHFVSRKTGHEMVEGFRESDFSYWYDEEEDMITPILFNTFEASGFTPILTSGNMDENGIWHETLACAEKIHNGKKYIICNVDLRCENPIAQRFLNRLKNR